MAWASVQEVDTGTDTGAGSGVKTVTIAAATAGNLLVVIATTFASLTGPGDATISGSGWTMVANNWGGAGLTNAFMWAKAAAGGETTITVTITGGLRLCVWAAEYSGNDGMTLDGSGGEWSGDFTHGGYVVSQPVPAYQGGLWVGMLTATAATGVGSPGFSTEQLHGATQRGATFSHHPAASLQLYGKAYDKLSGTSDDPVDIAGSDANAGIGTILGVCAVFKASGASAARTRAAGGGSATFVQSFTNATTATPGASVGGTPSATPLDGDLMVAVVSFDPARTITSAPAGWTLYGGAFFTHSAGGPILKHGVYYKVAAGESGAYTWVFDANSIGSVVFNEYGGGTYTPDVVPALYESGAVETWTGGGSGGGTGGKAWSGVIGPVKQGVTIAFLHFDGNAGGFTPDTYTLAGSTNPGGGSTFGHKVTLNYQLTGVEGIASDYFTLQAPGSGSGEDSPGWISFSFEIALGNEMWAWGEGQEGWAYR